MLCGDGFRMLPRVVRIIMYTTTQGLLRPLLIFALLLTFTSALAARPASAQSQRCFPETSFCIAGVIRTYWERSGGLAVFGYPISDPVYLRDRAHAVGSSGSLRHCARRPARNFLAGRVLAQLSPGTTPSSRTCKPLHLEGQHIERGVDCDRLAVLMRNHPLFGLCVVADAEVLDTGARCLC